jgi:hypothetical protein
MSAASVRQRLEKPVQKGDNVVEMLRTARADLRLALDVIEAAQRFRDWGAKITSFIEGDTEPFPARNNWVTYLHEAQDDTDRALDAFEAAP